MIGLSLYLTTLLLGANTSPAQVPVVQVRPAVVASVQMNAAEQKFVDLVNQERRQRNLNTLSANSLLVQVAREHSREMYEKNYFDHYSPTPGLRTPMNRYIHGLGYIPTWALVGENLFYCSIVDVDRGHRCLMDSPKHKDNILNPRFEQMGVGVYVSSDGRFWVTQMFLAQRG